MGVVVHRLSGRGATAGNPRAKSHSGAQGQPELEVQGLLFAGAPLGISLENAPAFTILVGWGAFSSIPVNLFGGTVYPNPFSIQLILQTDQAGALDLSATWPSGVPVGTDVYVQFIVQDASAIDRITLSNAVMATTP